MRIHSLVTAASTLTFGSVLLALTLDATGHERQGPTVQVSVQATDNTPGATLHYCWHSTDGVINGGPAHDSKTTSWTLPEGRGIHFAYVLVSNGKGGFTERRIAINTDSFRGDWDDDDDAVAPPDSGCVANPLPNVPSPTISNMTASLHGRPLSSRIAQFEPPPTGLPSDVEPGTDVFLSAAGTDTWKSACQYYKAVGAVGAATDCSTGKFVEPITYRDWQQAVKIGRFATGGTPTFRAAFVNKVDLNITRVHQSISYGKDNTAAVVSNHLGTKNFFDPNRDDIDDAVFNALGNRNLIAHVAMDDMPHQGINSGAAFVRFLIFGPGGELLPSINLDGRSEKFVPGTCTVCHGGSLAQFPDNGTGKPDIGAHFLPYDVGNFEFANAHGLRKCDQEETIFNLNQNVLNAKPTLAAQMLIGQTDVNGWYAKRNNGACAPNVIHVLDENYLPPTWPQQDPNLRDIYTNFIARSCRTCHVNVSGDQGQSNLNWDIYSNLQAFATSLPGYVCGTDGILTMPNSLLTFNRFWLSYRNHAGFPDQVQLLQNLLDAQQQQPPLPHLSTGNCAAFPK